MNTFEKIYNVIRQIPEGKVASYGQIAELAGNRRWSRVVGYVLHAVPDGSDIPCHRVVTKDGRVSRAFESCESIRKELPVEGLVGCQGIRKELPVAGPVGCQSIRRKLPVAGSGDAEGNRQVKLLEEEGVEFIDGHVDMKKYQWKKRVL